MAFAKTVERFTVTISGTATSNTVETTLGQDAAQCVLDVSQKTPRTTNESYNARLCRATISGTTITVTRGGGTDIGDISVHVTCIEMADGISVWQGTDTIAASAGNVSVNPTPDFTDIANAVLLHSTSNTYTAGSASISSHPLARGVITNGDDITFTRAGTTETVTCSWFAFECFGSEFTVQRGQLILGFSAETTTATLTTTVDTSKTFTIFSFSGNGSPDFRDIATRGELQDGDTVRITRANGGTASSQAVTSEWQAVEMVDGTVQRGTHTITATSATTDITTVDLDGAWPHSPSYHGFGEGDSTEDDDIGSFWAMVEMVDNNTVQSSVVTDIIDAEYGWEVIELALDAGSTVDGSFSGAGAGSGVIAVAGIKLRPTVPGAGAGSGSVSAKLKPNGMAAAGAGSGTVSVKLKPNGMAAAGAGAGSIAVAGLKLRVEISGGGAGAASASGIKLRVTVSGAGAGSGVVSAALAGVVEFLVLETESALEFFLTMEEYMSVLGIWNGALARLGHSPVTSAPTSDGTPVGDLLAANWPEFKAQFLRKTAWDGGKRTVLLTTFKNNDGVTPVAPVSPDRWSFCYALPADHVRSLRLNGRKNQPGPKSLGGLGLWEEETTANDVGLLRRCIFADDEPAYLEYVFLVPDADITLLPADMRRAMAKEFAVEVAPFFGKTESDLISLEQYAQKAVADAKRSDDQTGSKPTFIDRSMEQAFW